MESEQPSTISQTTQPEAGSEPDEVMELAHKQWRGGAAVGVTFTLIWLALVGLFFGPHRASIANSPFKEATNESQPHTALAPSSAPTTSASAELTREERSWVTVRILNGSGRAGAAQQVADLATAAGYTVLEVSNAPSRQGTLVTFGSQPANQSTILNDITSTLKLDATTLQVANESPPVSSSSAGLSLTIVLGK